MGEGIRAAPWDVGALADGGIDRGLVGLQFDLGDVYRQIEEAIEIGVSKLSGGVVPYHRLLRPTAEEAERCAEKGEK